MLKPSWLTTISVVLFILLAVDSKVINSKEKCGDEFCEDHQICDLRKPANCSENCEPVEICVTRQNRLLNILCKSGEEYKTCGSYCEGTCDTPNPICTFQCNYFKCQCKNGYLRDKNNNCIPNGHCPKKQKTCADIYCPKGQKCEMEKCQKKYGCQPTPKCVSSYPTCPENEEYKQCGSQCEPTCEKPKQDYCNPLCVKNVCQCKPGYYRNSYKKCVSKNDCPYVPPTPTCPYNEEYKTCGSACEPSCQNPDPDYCTTDCVPNVCQCVKGYYRNEKKECVTKDKCPYHPPSDPCSTMYCPAGTKCEVEACYQQPCYPTAKCVAYEPTCPQNEHYEKCGGCEGNCTNQYPTCTAECKPGKCVCNPDYVRDSYNKCIPFTNCPYRG